METEPTTQRKRTRRGSDRPRCAREGCDRRVGGGYVHCSQLCSGVDRALTQTENVCTAVGPGDRVSELWASVVGLNDALTEYLRLMKAMYRDAVQSGMSDEQWTALRDGRTPHDAKIPA